ncbi:MAG TPA: serine hydrolase domain-containing protein [Micromonosporaceae bacterium]
MSLSPETIHRIDVLAADGRARGQVPSLVIGVIRDGELVHVAGAGEQPAPDPHTHYRIGSITKTMTAVSVLQLRDEGRLGLDDPLHRHLPDTPVGHLTLRQLLGHAGGLQREPDGPWWERSEGGDVAALLAGLSPEKIAFPPYRLHHYSNLAYGLLGAVIEHVTGERWWDRLRDRVLEPLGMRRTSYQAQEPFARGYVRHPWLGTLREEPRTDTGAMAPAGQLWSTVSDLARWAAFLADPEPAVLAPATLAEMCVPVILSDLESWSSGHGLGLELYRVGERIYVGHGGSMPGYQATLAVHRPSRTAVVGYGNVYNFRDGHLGALGKTVLTTVLDHEPVPAPARLWRPAAAPPPASAAELCGRWWWMGREFEASWDDRDQELLITPLPWGQLPPWRFREQAPDRWRGTSGMNNGEVLQVRRDPGGAVEALDIATFILTRDPDRLS